MVLQFITWQVAPEIFKIGPFSIRYYGLMFASAFFFGYYVLSKIFRKEGVSIETLDKFTVYVAVGTIAGARLGHCLFYEPGYYLSHPLEMLLPIAPDGNGGFKFTGYQGLASHGGAVGIVIALIIFMRKFKLSLLWLLDRMAIGASLGGFFIRLGNLFNSEIYGTQTSLPWGFIFKLRGETVPKHPTQLYEALSYLLLFIGLYWYHNKKEGKIKNGVIFSFLLIIMFIARFLIEFVKEEQVDFERGMAINMGQWLSLPFIMSGIILLIILNRRKTTESK